MSIRHPTLEQLAAISLRGASVALSAGAGCGKTAVLTERFLSEFDPGNPQALRPEQVGQMVAITFTEAAAREMRQRIRNRCYQQLDNAAATDPAAIEYWTQMLRSLDSARISTIHSFCASLIRSNAVEAGVDPQFGVLEQGEAEALAAETIDDALRALLAESAGNDADILALLTIYSMDELRGMLTSLLHGRDRSAYKRWLEQSPESLVEIWKENHQRKALPAIAEKMMGSPFCQQLKRLAAEGPSPHPKMIERSASILAVLTAWENGSSPAAFTAELDQLNEAARVQHVNRWHSNEAKTNFKQAAEKVREEITKCRRNLRFDDAAAITAARTGLQLLRVAVAALDRYTDRKRALERLDFDDLLIAAHRLLTSPESADLRQRLSSQIRLLLVDEFQDTDPLQVELVRALCGTGLDTGKLFFVGDLKQSIYRFRGAQPEVFVDLEASMPTEGRLPLSTNFRSQPAVLDFVNALFHNELTSGYQRLSPNRVQVAPRPAIEFLWAQLPEGAHDTLAATRRKEEARWIARRLRQLLDRAEPIVWESETSARPARPGDVALLFRALSDVRYYEQALQQYGIPYYLVGGSAFYAQQEVFDVVNLLRAICSPADAVALVGALRSPLFSLPDEAIFWLAQHAGGVAEGLFADAIANEIGPDARRQVEFARDTLRALRQIKNRVPVAELLDRAVSLTGYDAVLLAEFLGERKLANLHKLIEMARSFDAAGIFSLEDFIDRLASSVADQPREAFAAIHPEAGDVVRLMSIHHSKGLEFPVVVVPDLDRSKSGDRDRVAFSTELGPLVAAAGDANDGEGLSSGLKLHQLLTSPEEEAESRRLLYVATTRAADYLILSSCPKDLQCPDGSWMNLLARHFELATGKLTEPLPPGFEAPQVRVTREIPETSFKPIDGKTRPDLSRIVAKADAMAADGKGLLPADAGALHPDPRARRQFSFSQLTGELQRDAPEAAATAAAEYLIAAPVNDALGLGTLVHAVLADPVLSRAESAAASEIKRIVHLHAERQRFDPHDEIESAIEMVARFVQSPLAARLRSARANHTELEFVLGWPPGEVENGGPFLSGFIDRLWQDSDGDWHVLDFKTNRVTTGNLASTAAKYEMQMLLYALAVEQCLNAVPKSLTLHFLRTGEEYTFAWNPAARRRVIEMVSAAIAAARSRNDHQPV